MQYFRTQEEAQKLFLAIRLVQSATLEDIPVIALDTNSELDTLNLMADMITLLQEHELVKSKYKVVIKHADTGQRLAVLKFTNTNTPPEFVKGIKDSHILDVQTIIRMDYDSIERMFIPEVDFEALVQ